MKKGLTTLLFTFMVTMAMGQGMVEGYNDFINQAKAGDANAQYYIGLFYDQGRDVPKDHQKAMEWWNKAAEKGHIRSQLTIAKRYFLGRGVEKDVNKAVFWWNKAIEVNDENEEALFMLAKCYENGIGVPKDFLKAILLYQRAIDTEYLEEDDEEIAKSKVQELTVMLNASKNEKAQQQTSGSQNPSMNVSTSAVDRNIIVSNTTNSSTFAVIIGNEDYKNEAKVPFAENDARVFKEYVHKTLGVPEKQIHYVANASLNDLRGSIRWLKQAMQICEGKGKAIFYYAGHGIPDEADKTAYLLPIDGAGGDTETGYSLQKLFNEFSNMSAQRVTVFLDACFSGTKREGGMLASARGVAIPVKAASPTGNIVVFSACQGSETAYPFKAQSHGMFTYYLLKKLQDTKGNATLGELSDYLTREVKRQSFVENNKMQTPTVKTSSSMGNSWQNMKLK